MSSIIDTSGIVALLCVEKKSDLMLGWLGRQAPETLVTSDWVAAEVSAALSIKIRDRQLRRDSRNLALSQFHAMKQRLFTKLEFRLESFGLAAVLADRVESGVRAGDALHLAICAYYCVSLCTLDGGKSSAGSELGIPTLLL